MTYFFQFIIIEFSIFIYNYKVQNQIAVYSRQTKYIPKILVLV